MTDQASPNEKFEFDPPMQDDVLRLIVKNQSVAEAASHWVKPHYFVDPTREWLANSALDFLSTFGMPPTVSEARQMLRVALTAGDVKSEKANDYEATLRAIYEEPLKGAREFTIEQVQQFARDRAWEKAIMAAIPLKKQGKFGEVSALMEEASRAVYDLDDGVYWLFESAKERTRRRATGMDDQDVVPMGMMELDELLRRKGFGPGESVVWIAPKGGGKSIALGHVARRAVIDRRKTILFSMEMREDQVADRQDSGFSGVDMWLMREEHERVMKAMGRFAKTHPKHMAIKRYDTGSGSIADMDRCLENLRKSEGWKVGFIALDYMGLVKPSRRHEKRYEEYKELSEEYRGLLGKWEVPGHTAAQLTRSGAKSQTADGTEVAGMWDALATFDYIYVINQTAEERRKGVLRIFIDKARDGKDKIEVGPLETAWERMQFIVRPNSYPWERMQELDMRKVERENLM